MPFPRLVSGEHLRTFARDTLSSGSTELAALLGGGIERGSSTLILGPAGTGKSLLALTFAVAAAARGEKSALFIFDEECGLLFQRALGLGIDLQAMIDTGLLFVAQVDADADMRRSAFSSRSSRPRWVGAETGLGLSQVIGFAKQSGGDIQVESRSGQGTTFTLYLPRAQPGDAHAAQTVKPAGGMAGEEDTCVLVVEDNEQVGVFATETLRELGYDSVLATDAAQALTTLEQGRDRFQIVFSDVVMPGIEFAGEVRRRYAGLPAVLTSGYSHVHAQSGSHGFELLHKPYSLEQISRILRKAALIASFHPKVPAHDGIGDHYGRRQLVSDPWFSPFPHPRVDAGVLDRHPQRAGSM